MSIIPSPFFKTIQITIGSGEAATLSRTYNDRVEDTSLIIVYYNGQAILNDTGISSPTEKYYYTVSTTRTTTADVSLVAGHCYKITASGTSNWTVAGASSSTVGTIFIATGATTTGSGGFAEDLNSGSTVVFNVYANTAYTGPGYASGVSTISMSTFDTLAISYYYIIYTD